MSKKETDNSSEDFNKIWPSVEPKDVDPNVKAEKPELTEKDIEQIKEERLTTYVPYSGQSLVYLFGATVWQSASIMNNPALESLSSGQVFGTQFISFALPSWGLLTLILWFIEKDKPKEARSNVALYLGIGFFLLLFF